MSSVKLTIKNADFSTNALGVIIEGDITLSLFTSKRNYRGYSMNGFHNGDFGFFYTSSPADTWSTFAVDVSRFIGMKVRITYNNGYSANINGNGAFLNASAPAFSQGFGQNSSTTQFDNYQQYLVGLICPVESADDGNVDLTAEYTVPVGAKWLVFTSKSAGVAVILAD